MLKVPGLRARSLGGANDWSGEEEGCSTHRSMHIKTSVRTIQLWTSRKWLFSKHALSLSSCRSRRRTRIILLIR